MGIISTKTMAKIIDFLTAHISKKENSDDSIKDTYLKYQNALNKYKEELTTHNVNKDTISTLNSSITSLKEEIRFSKHWLGNKIIIDQLEVISKNINDIPSHSLERKNNTNDINQCSGCLSKIMETGEFPPYCRLTKDEIPPSTTKFCFDRIKEWDEQNKKIEKQNTELYNDLNKLDELMLKYTHPMESTINNLISTNQNISQSIEKEKNKDIYTM